MKIVNVDKNNRYQLLQNADSGEVHILIEGECICGYRKSAHDRRLDFFDRKIFDEEKTRYICYKIGRGVCGTCISSLYGTENLDKQQINQAIATVEEPISRLRRKNIPSD